MILEDGRNLNREDASDHESEPGHESDQEVAAETTEHGGKATLSPPHQQDDGGLKDDATEVKPDEFVLEDIPREEDMSAWEIPKFMAEYITKYAKEHVSDTDMAAWVEEYPPPSNLKMVPELDAAIKRSLREDGKGAVVDADDDLARIQSKIQDVLGPLGVAWAQLHQHIHGTFPQLDGKGLLDQLQKAATLVAHSMQKVSWYRRIHVLGGVGKVKEVKEVLKREKTQEIFKKDTTGQLFSKEFYDSIKPEKSSKPSNVVDLFKTKKKDSTPAAKGKSTSASTSKLISTGSKRPFSSNPFQMGVGSRYNNGNSGRDGYYKSKNPFNSNNNNYRDYNKGKYKINLHRQHAVNSNMAAKFMSGAPGNMADISGHARDGPLGRKSSKIPSQLEGSDKRQKSLEHCKRVAGSFNLDPDTKKCAEGNKNEQNGGNSHGYGDREHVDERSYKGGHPKTRSIPEQCLCHPKRGGEIQTDHKSEGLEPICSLPSFQDGGVKGSQAPIKERGLDVQDGSERRVLFDSSASRVTKVCQVLAERDSVRVPLSGLWPRTGSADLHKINEGPDLPSQKVRNMSGHLSGRPANNGTLEGRTSPSTGHNFVPISSSRTHHKYGKVGTGAFPDYGIPRSSSEQSGAHLCPEAKIQKLISKCHQATWQPEMSLRELCSLTGTLRATAPAVSPAPLQIRFLQQLSIQAQTRKLHYDSKIPITHEGKLELKWWIENLEILKGNPIYLPPPELTICSDAARTGGWGAVCHLGSTGGQWSTEERFLNINLQELIAVELAIKFFFYREKINSLI